MFIYIFFYLLFRLQSDAIKNPVQKYKGGKKKIYNGLFSFEGHNATAVHMHNDGARFSNARLVKNSTIRRVLQLNQSCLDLQYSTTIYGQCNSLTVKNAYL